MTLHWAKQSAAHDRLEREVRQEKADYHHAALRSLKWALVSDRVRHCPASKQSIRASIAGHQAALTEMEPAQ